MLQQEISDRYLLFRSKKHSLTSLVSDLLVKTSDDSCFNVCVRFLEASAKARVSSKGFVVVLPHLQGTFLHTLERGTLDEVVVREDAELKLSNTEEVWDLRVLVAAGSGEHTLVAVAMAAVSIGMSTELLGWTLHGDFLELEDEVEEEEVEEEIELAVVERRLVLGEIVDSCSWISIIWSPRRIVRFRGAFPDRKSLTWNSGKQKCGYNNNKDIGIHFKRATLGTWAIFHFQTSSIVIFN